MYTLFFRFWISDKL